jgi:hypothetical protein
VIRICVIHVMQGKSTSYFTFVKFNRLSEVKKEMSGAHSIRLIILQVHVRKRVAGTLIYSAEVSM